MYIKYLPGEKHPGKQIEISKTHESFTDCGYDLEESDLVVDIDSLDKDVIRKIIQWFNIKTQVVWTTRGAHLYFKKPGTFRGAECVCALGFKVEYKHRKNTPNGVTIKQNGVLRDIDNEGFREDLPPIFRYASRKYDVLKGLTDGEGRNKAMYKHKGSLGRMENADNVMRFINTYILADPLDENELKLVMRDTKAEVKKDNEYELGTYIMEKYRTVLYMGAIYYKDGDEYINDDEKFRQILFEEFPNQRTTRIEEIFKQVKLRSEIQNGKKTFDIKLNNGFLRKGKFISINLEEFTPYCIKLDYDPEAPDDENVMRYIDHLTKGDAQYRDLLFEVLGHTLIVNKEFKRAMAKFFIFIGGGGNGKGTLLTVIKEILGEHNCSGMSVSEITDERYLPTLQGKLANLGDDIQDAPIDHKQMKMLKSISSCDFISVRKMYENARNMSISASLIFASNHILKSFEKGESYKRRVIWLPMYTEVKNVDPLFISKITSPDALVTWIKYIIEGYRRLYSQNGFSQCQLVSLFNQEYHQENNNALMFLDDLEADDIVGKHSVEVHEEYKAWAEENGLHVGSQKMLISAIRDKFKLDIVSKKLSGKTHRVYDFSEKMA